MNTQIKDGNVRVRKFGDDKSTPKMFDNVCTDDDLCTKYLIFARLQNIHVIAETWYQDEGEEGEWCEWDDEEIDALIEEYLGLDLDWENEV